MNGLPLIASVINQVEVASTNRTFLTPPSGAIAHSSVAKTARASSDAMPAEAMIICLRRSTSFQVSPVSV